MIPNRRANPGQRATPPKPRANVGPCEGCGLLVAMTCYDCKKDRGLEVYICDKPECRRDHKTSRCSAGPLPVEMGNIAHINPNDPAYSWNRPKD